MSKHEILPLADGDTGPLSALLADGTPDGDRIAAFLERGPFPIVEPGLATFAYLGPAEAVELVRWIHAGADRVPFLRVPGTDLWLLRLGVEDGGRFEYKLSVRQGGQDHLILDPLNPVRAGDPFGENSVCRTYGYARPDWTRRQGAPAGRLEEVVVDSEAFETRRHEQVYLPAGYDAHRRYPVVVIHDGADFDTYAGLTVALDNLIAAGDVPPLIAVLTQTGDRMGEYPRARRHARYLVEELLPAVDARWPISRDPAHRVLLGASLGAVASLATAFRYPGTFGGLVLKSGSFIFDRDKLAGRPHPVFGRVADLVSAFKRVGHRPALRAFVSTGELEGLAEENRKMADWLKDRGVAVTFQSAWDGHHWHNWRDQLRDGLMAVLTTNDTPAT